MNQHQVFVCPYDVRFSRAWRKQRGCADVLFLEPFITIEMSLRRSKHGVIAPLWTCTEEYNARRAHQKPKVRARTGSIPEQRAAQPQAPSYPPLFLEILNEAGHRHTAWLTTSTTSSSISLFPAPFSSSPPLLREDGVYDASTTTTTFFPARRSALPWHRGGNLEHGRLELTPQHEDG